MSWALTGGVPLARRPVGLAALRTEELVGIISRCCFVLAVAALSGAQ